MMKDEKIVPVCSIKCPFCGQLVDVKKKVKTIAPAVKAEKEEEYFAEKNVQTKLLDAKAEP